MNETGHNTRHGCSRWGGRAGVRWGAVAIGLVAASQWGLLGGCADPRTEPTAPRSPGYTETIVLWDKAVSGGEKISAAFSVDQPLAPIRDLENDHPARLTVVAYIYPDSTILRRELIIFDSLPYLNDLIIGYQVRVFAFESSLDSALLVDSLCRTLPDCGYDTTGLGAFIVWLRDTMLVVYNDSLAAAMLDTTRLGHERDSLNHVLDDRFTLALWMDSDTTTRYPLAVWDTLGFLGGQQIYAAATGDASTPLPGMKGRGFRLNLERFAAADAFNPGRSLQVNWTQCFAGLDLPCMSVGGHTLHARVTGAGSRITATLVLVYQEVTP